MPSVETITATDDELVAAVCAGDEASFEILFERHRRRVALTVGKFFREREQIEDLVQETFVKAFFAINSFSGEHEKSFSAWLARIAVNAAYDELRRAKRQPASVESELSETEIDWLSRQASSDSEQNNIENGLVRRDLAEKLLSRLQPEDRLVLTLLNGEEMSAAEISTLTGWSVAKVKIRAHRARSSLRRILKKFL